MFQIITSEYNSIKVDVGTLLGKLEEYMLAEEALIVRLRQLEDDHVTVDDDAIGITITYTFNSVKFSCVGV